MNFLSDYPSLKPIVLSEITSLRQYIGVNIVYFLKRQGGSNLLDESLNNSYFADFLGVHQALPIQKVYSIRCNNIFAEL